MRIIYSHGKFSGPAGNKAQLIRKLADRANMSFVPIDYTGMLNPDQRVSKLLDSYNEMPERQTILIGSSMGAYVSIVGSFFIKPLGIFAISPAIGLNGYLIKNPTPNALHKAIIHGSNDELISQEIVKKYASEHHFHLDLIDGNHSLKEHLAAIENSLKTFLVKTGKLRAPI